MSNNDNDTQNSGEDALSFSTSDDDEELSDLEEDCERLCWSRDPENSFFSDYKIEILVRGNVHGCYFVHTAILAVGPKKSIYFTRLFSNQSFVESETKTSRIELEELAAIAFPVFLDYLYAFPDEELQITNENVGALHYIGQYFESSHLRKCVRNFWKNNMTFENCWVYYQQAKIFHDKAISKEVVKAVVKKCCEEKDEIEIPEKVDEFEEVASRLIQESDEHMWLDALKRNSGVPNSSLSLLIFLFCELANNMDVGIFLELTREKVLPAIHWKAALRLLKHEKSILSASGTSDEPTSLQKRCIEGLSKSWTRLDSSSTMEYLKELSPLVLSKVLAQTIEQAKKQPFVPDTIVVSGAAVPAVNGVYTRMDTFRRGAPRYTMHGEWEGEATRFDIFMSTENETYQLKWYIAIFNADASPSKEAANAWFYAAKPSENILMLPPQGGWVIVRDGPGRRPGPTLEYR